MSPDPLADPLFWNSESVSLLLGIDVWGEIMKGMAYRLDKRLISQESIPLKPAVNEIGSSKAIALQRFYALERRLRRDDEIRAQYIDFMREYEDLGHMVEVFNEPEHNTMCYYIPHYCVMSSGKFRCVFDGSCKTGMSISLNDAQLECPKLQRDLYEIIMLYYVSIALLTTVNHYIASLMLKCNMLIKTRPA